MSENSKRLVEPLAELNRIKISECGEPLVLVSKYCPAAFITSPAAYFKYSPVFKFRRVLIRKTIAQMLNEAQSYLPKTHKLLIKHGYRSLRHQRKIYAMWYRHFQKLHPRWPESALKRATNRFAAPLDTQTPPPHTTGGAVDLTIAGLDNKALDMISPLPIENWWQDPETSATASKKITEAARLNRKMLIKAMTRTGFTNYPSEWWHWSYGDSGWAWRTGRPVAIYGRVKRSFWE